MAPQERNSIPCEDASKNPPSPQTPPTPGENGPHDSGFFHRLPPTVDIALNYNKNSNESKAAFINNGFQADSSLELRIPSISIQKELDDEDLTSFDDLLPYIGEFGLYQRILFLLMIPFAFFIAFVYFAQIFLTLVPEQHWCQIPELQNLTQHQRVSLGIPTNEDGSFQQCFQYDVDWSSVLQGGIPERPDPSWSLKKCDRGYEFNFTDVPYATIATELEWVCDKNDRGATAQAIFFCGSILGGLVFGWIADKYGRIPALVGTNMAGFLAGLATAFCSAFWQFCLCRFLVGLAFDNCFTMMYILVLEYVGPHWRTFVANMSIALFFTLSTCLLPWIAWFIADWRTFAIVTSVPLAIAIVTPFVIPESAMWLVTQGQTDKALKIMSKFERINKKKIPDNVLHNFKETIKIMEKEEAEAGNKTYSVIDLFRTPRLRFTVILLVVIWMIISLVFDGHVRNVGSLGLNIFLTFTIAAATELPADTFLTLVLDRWGRRWLAFGTLAFSGIFSICATAVPLGVYSATLAILGRFSVNIAYNVGLQYAAELLPTVVRAQGVAFIHIMGYVASILAPYVVYLGTFYQPLPLMILGTLGMIGGVLCLLLPESMDQDLPQTLQDGEEFGKNQKFWDAPCWKAQEEDEEHPGHYTRRPSITSFRSYASQRSNMFLRPGIVGLRAGVLRSSTMRSQNSVANASMRSGRSTRRDSIRASMTLRPRTFSIVSTKSNTSRHKTPLHSSLSIS